MEYSSLESLINEHADQFIWNRIIEHVVNVTKKYVINTQEEYLAIYHWTLDDLKEKFPEEYEYVTTKQAFTFKDICSAIHDGMQLHAYACRNNQAYRYVMLDEEDYKEGSKYYERWEHRFDNMKNIEKDKYKIWSKI